MAEKPIQVTLKMAAGYDAPWVTISGEYDEVESNLKKIIEGTFGETMAEASQRVQGAWLLIGKPKAQGGVGAKTEKKSETKPAETAAETPTEPDEDPVSKAIKAATTKAAMAEVWAKNQKAFKDNPALMELMKSVSATLTV